MCRVCFCVRRDSRKVFKVPSTWADGDDLKRMLRVKWNFEPPEAKTLNVSLENFCLFVFVCFVWLLYFWFHIVGRYFKSPLVKVNCKASCLQAQQQLKHRVSLQLQKLVSCGEQSMQTGRKAWRYTGVSHSRWPNSQACRRLISQRWENRSWGWEVSFMCVCVCVEFFSHESQRFQRVSTSILQRLTFVI